MTYTFPKRQKTDVTAEIGINVVSTVFNDYFGWIFRRTHQEHDFGVDSYVDYVTDEGFVTGQSVAVQVKTGKSYLSKNGNNHWYYDSKEHLNYFLNLPIPILLIICDPDTRECYWDYLDKNKVDYRENNWRHPIPKNNKLSVKHKAKIRSLFGETKDHISEFESDQEFLKLISNDSIIMYSVPKEDIEKRNLDNLKSFLNRISRNERLTLAVQGKLCICTYGYENDPREVYQIKEIRRWSQKARKKINEWYICATDVKKLSTLRWIAACTCDIKSIKTETHEGRTRFLKEFDSKELSDFIVECYDGLNQATEKWGWTTEYNYKISKIIHNDLFPDIKYPDLNKHQ